METLPQMCEKEATSKERRECTAISSPKSPAHTTIIIDGQL
jgi:hypothetical protein